MQLYIFTACNSLSERFTTWETVNIHGHVSVIGRSGDGCALPVSTHIGMVITSPDILHSLAVPSLGVETDA